MSSKLITEVELGKKTVLCVHTFYSVYSHSKSFTGKTGVCGWILAQFQYCVLLSADDRLKSQATVLVTLM